MSTTDLARLLSDAFPGGLPPDCWARRAVEENQADFEEIGVVEQAGERASLIRRLQAEHPLDRDHHGQHDERLLDVFNEAAAFAWAYRSAQLGKPQFVFHEGAPDLKVGDWWIEAKAIHNSDYEKQELRALHPLLESVGVFSRGWRRLGPVPMPVMTKLHTQLDDAVKKWRRQNSGRLAIFFDVRLDFGVSFREGPKTLCEWGTGASESNGVRIVICQRERSWRNPLLDTERP